MRSSSSKLVLIMVAIWAFLAVHPGSCQARYFYPKRVPDMGTECMSANGMNRELRSGSLNHYLSEMIRCLAAVARPRFGKRSGDVPARTWKFPSLDVARLGNPVDEAAEENPVVQQPMEVLRRLMIASRKMS